MISVILDVYFGHAKPDTERKRKDRDLPTHVLSHVTVETFDEQNLS